ncbi:MAG: DUF3833 family protein [Chthoniobacterales bacterium]|nr:DUF3833 family protein [Chthoniobacterales bacterium]
MRNPLRIWLLGAALSLAGCASFSTSELSLAHEGPALDPIAFFAGRTVSAGMIENTITGSKRRVTTETRGHRDGNTLRLEQNLTFSDGSRQHRSWRIRKLDAHHYEATANDMVGAARGEADGNAFHWSFTLALSPGNPLANVRMSQAMFLQPGGRSLINHTTIRKLGIVVAKIDETFRSRVAGP